MPLPASDNKTAWPPPAWQPVYTLYAEHDAWYSGDPLRLSNYYASTLSGVDTGFFNTQTGAPPRGKFWARLLQAERRLMLHVPVAGDIASTSASMLFSEHPLIKIPEAHSETAVPDAKSAQQRLDDIIAKGNVYSTILEAAEIASAMGGVYLKVNWDEGLASFPLLSIAQPDNAVPEFKFGILTAVTFWQELEETDKGDVWRRVERHEPGVILNGLYLGKRDTLGQQMNLEARTETAGLPESIRTGAAGLACVYIPNIRPNRRFRGLQVGQSDYSGSEGIFDSIDEVWTSWMRDIRLGQGRIIAPEEFFESDGAGAMSFNLDREAYVGINVPGVSGQNVNQSITVSQFEIRSEQHYTALKALLVEAFTNAGYSPQTFGLDVSGSAESGTALRVRERKSFTTTAKKAEYWTGPLEYICELMLTIDKVQLRGGVQVYRPTVEIQDSIQGDVGELAQSVELLNRAQAASLKTKVMMLHPDWEPAQVAAEVELIMQETGQSLPDPALIGRA